MNRILVVLTICFAFISAHFIHAQSHETETEIIYFGDEAQEHEDSIRFEYYYDWDMPRYAIGLNLNSLLSFTPAYMGTFDIGLDDHRRIAIEAGYIPNFAEQRGFKIRTTYQKFFTKNDIFGAYVGGGVNLVSFWEPRVDRILLEDRYWRLLKENRNRTFLSGVAEVGTTFNFGRSRLLEFTMGLGFGVQRAGGTYVIEDEWNFNVGVFPEDPGFYINVPFYFNMSYSYPIAHMIERI